VADVLADGAGLRAENNADIVIAFCPVISRKEPRLRAALILAIRVLP
jgi:hypothetical protein